MKYIEFMKSFHLACWNKLVAVRLISASRAQKPFDSYFLDMVYVEFYEISSSRRFEEADALLDSFEPPELKNVWFLLSRHNVGRVQEKFSSRLLEPASGC